MGIKDRKIQRLADALDTAWSEVKRASTARDQFRSQAEALLKLASDWQTHLDAESWNSSQSHWECPLCGWQSNGMVDLTGKWAEPDHLDYAARSLTQNTQ